MMTWRLDRRKRRVLQGALKLPVQVAGGIVPQQYGNQSIARKYGSP